MELKVTRKSHSRREFVEGKDGKRTKRTVNYAKGETFDGTERELKQFSDRLEATGKSAQPAAPAGPTVPQLQKRAGELNIDYGKKWTKPQLIEAIEKAEAEELAQLREYAEAMDLDVADEATADELKEAIAVAEQGAQ